MSEERETYRVEGRTEVRHEARLPFASANFRQPSKDEFRTVTQTLGLTGSMVGQLLGVDTRTVRKWIGGERDIPYSAWRLLLIEAGLALPVPSGYEDERQLTWGAFKNAMAAHGVRDVDVVERMSFTSKAFQIRRIEQHPDEPRYVSVVGPPTKPAG